MMTTPRPMSDARRVPFTDAADACVDASATARVLLPVDGGAAALGAVRRVAGQFAGRARPAAVWLVHVHAPLSRHATRFVAPEALKAWRRERAEAAFAEPRRLLDRAGVGHRSVELVGDAATRIAQAALDIGCGRIVVGASRMSVLSRLAENSLVPRLLEVASVPVEVVAGADAPLWRQLRAPVAVGAAMAAMAAIAVD